MFMDLDELESSSESDSSESLTGIEPPEEPKQERNSKNLDKPICLLCLNKINYEEIHSIGKLSNYLVNKFTKFLHSKEVCSFQLAIRETMVCSHCHETIVEYQMALEQLDLIRKKIYKFSAAIESSISKTTLKTITPSKFSTTREQIHKALTYICLDSCGSENRNIAKMANKNARILPNSLPNTSQDTFKIELENVGSEGSQHSTSDNTRSAKTSISDIFVDDEHTIPKFGNPEQVLTNKLILPFVKAEEMEPGIIGLKEVKIVLNRCDESCSSKLTEVINRSQTEVDVQVIFQTNRLGNKASMKSRIQKLRKKLKQRAQNEKKIKKTHPIFKSKEIHGGKITSVRKPPGYYKCKLCTFTTSVSSTFSRHRVRAHSTQILRPFPCKFFPCNFSFMSSIRLEAHENRSHRNISFICNEENCRKKVYYTQLYLDKHKLKHDYSARKFPCDQCPSRFFNNCQLKAHKARHEGVKPYLCELCSTGFLRKPDFEDHQAYAHGVKTPLGIPTCSICEFTATSRYYIKQHKKLTHNRAELKHACVEPGCSYRTFAAANLAAHAISHTNEKTLMCHHCPMTFKRPASLNLHVKVTHEGFRYKCSHCPAEYSFHRHLKNHMETTHLQDNNKHLCDLCGKKFLALNTLLKHKWRCPKGGKVAN